MITTFWRAVLAATVLAGLAVEAEAARKKKNKEEEVTQVLEVPKDPPPVVVTDAHRLVFHSTPLSAKGLLSQQVRDGLKSLFSLVRGAQIVRLRAFVAGSGDLRRVPAIVSEVFTDRRQPIPVVSVVQVGGLGLEGSQLVMESTAVDKRPVNPHGIGFAYTESAPAAQVPELLKTAAGSHTVRRITCYANALENADLLRTAVAQSFTGAPFTLVQLRRDSLGDSVSCEAITAPAGGDAPRRVAFTGAQLVFGRSEADVRLAFDRLGKVLEGAGAGWDTTILTSWYPLYGGVSTAAAAEYSRISGGRKPVPTSTLIFEGLPSLDASLAVEAVAAVR